MRPVNQLLVDRERGDCMRACIASILELPAEDVPNFRERQTDMSPGINAWLAPRGLAFLALPMYAQDVNIWHISAYCILGMPSQLFPGGSHAVVGQLKVDADNTWSWKIVHDPNPRNKPYDRTIEPLRMFMIIRTFLQ